MNKRKEEEDLVLSTGKLCPRCGCESLEEYWPLNIRFTDGLDYDKHFSCVALCGMEFGLARLNNGKVRIGYDKENEIYLKERFKLKPIEEEL